MSRATRMRIVHSREFINMAVLTPCTLETHVDYYYNMDRVKHRHI